jgi:hypothetical protein
MTGQSGDGLAQAFFRDAARNRDPGATHSHHEARVALSRTRAAKLSAGNGLLK